MTEMIERIARAALVLDDTIWVGDNQMLYFRRVAVAAIEEMRKPTEAMCEAGQKANNLDETPGHFEFLSRDEMTEAWQAMCDEALK